MSDGRELHDPRPALREEILTLCGSISIRLEVLSNMAALGDDVGLVYAFRCLTAEWRAMAAHMRDIRALNDAERHAEMEATYTELGKAEAPQCD